MSPTVSNPADEEAPREEVIEAGEADVLEQEADQAVRSSSPPGGDESQLSANFRLAEFNCNDGTPVPESAVPALQRLCREVLQPLRDTFGRGTVVSGYRTRSYNDSLRAKSSGVAQNSQHIYDDGPDSVAADMKFESGTPQEWHAAAEPLLGESGGLGLYRTFIHCDNRSQKARW